MLVVMIWRRLRADAGGDDKEEAAGGDDKEEADAGGDDKEEAAC